MKTYKKYLNEIWDDEITWRDVLCNFICCRNLKAIAINSLLSIFFGIIIIIGTVAEDISLYLKGRIT